LQNIRVLDNMISGERLTEKSLAKCSEGIKNMAKDMQSYFVFL